MSKLVMAIEAQDTLHGIYSDFQDVFEELYSVLDTTIPSNLDTMDALQTVLQDVRNAYLDSIDLVKRFRHLNI